jgi:hypothetical protein
VKEAGAATVASSVGAKDLRSQQQAALCLTGTFPELSAIIRITADQASWRSKWQWSRGRCKGKCTAALTTRYETVFKHTSSILFTCDMLGWARHVLTAEITDTAAGLTAAAPLQRRETHRQHTQTTVTARTAIIYLCQTFQSFANQAAACAEISAAESPYIRCCCLAVVPLVPTAWLPARTNCYHFNPTLSMCPLAGMMRWWLMTSRRLKHWQSWASQQVRGVACCCRSSIVCKAFA